MTLEDMETKLTELAVEIYWLQNELNTKRAEQITIELDYNAQLKGEKPEGAGE